MTSSATLEFGRPASHVRLMARRRLARLAVTAVAGGVAAAAAVTVLAAVASLPSPVPTPVVVAAAGVATAVAAGRAAAGPYRQARAGVRSEVTVAKVLRRCRPAAIVHGALLGASGGDADHVVLGRVCALVETKTGRGPVTVTGDGRLQLGRKRLPRDPVEQARRQARKVQQTVGVSCTPVVCIVNASGRWQVHDGVVICSARQLPHVLAQLPAVVNPEVARQRAQLLAAADQRTSGGGRGHRGVSRDAA